MLKDVPITKETFFYTIMFNAIYKMFYKGLYDMFWKLFVGLLMMFLFRFKGSLNCAPKKGFCLYIFMLHFNEKLIMVLLIERCFKMCTLLMVLLTERYHKIRLPLDGSLNWALSRLLTFLRFFLMVLLIERHLKIVLNFGGSLYWASS